MVVEAHADRLVGVVLGGTYRLVGRIGEGGMGAVYEAHHLRIQKRVAVKVMNQSMAGDVDAVARFHREASVASRLGHPNLVHVSDFGSTTEGQPYLVMEFLEGEDLERRLRRAGPVKLRSAVHLTRQVASALSVVHAKGIVHRDLKPANIFLTPVPGETELVKVLDFGVSKIKAAHTKITDSRFPIGTPQYMSPEQASGSSEEVDHRTDQWALACIVWEMLTGRVPFHADNMHALFFQAANTTPGPLSKWAPELPQAIEPVLLRALAKKPSDRYPTVREFARAFESAALGDWAELTPMPIHPAKLATFIKSLPPADGDSATPAPISVAGFESTAFRLRLPRLNLKSVITGVSTLIVCAAAWVLISHSRETRPAAVPAVEHAGKAAEASPRPATPRVEVLPSTKTAHTPAVAATDARRNSLGGERPAGSIEAVPGHAQPQANKATAPRAKDGRTRPRGRAGTKNTHGQWRIFEEL